MAVKEQNFGNLLGELAQSEGIGRPGAAILLDFPQKVLGLRDLAGILARRLPIQILDEIPTALGEQREEFAKRHLLIVGGMASVIDDHVERTALDPGSDRTDLLHLRLIADKG